MAHCKRLAASWAVGLVLAIGSFDARAQACEAEPSVSNSASFQRWSAWCRCVGGTPASNFTDAQKQGGCRRPSDTSSFLVPIPGGGSIGTIIGTGLGRALVDWLSGDPAAEARKKQEAEMAAARQRAQEEAERAEALRQQELAKQRILGALKLTEPSGGLELKTEPAAPAPLPSATNAAPAASAPAAPVAEATPSGGGLQLKLGDDAESPGAVVSPTFGTGGENGAVRGGAGSGVRGFGHAIRGNDSKKRPSRAGVHKGPKAGELCKDWKDCGKGADGMCTQCCEEQRVVAIESCRKPTFEASMACQREACKCNNACLEKCGMTTTPCQ